jgi:L-rhamnose mutarotase
MKRWWEYMADVMETGSKNVPVQMPLKRVFYLP